MPAESQISKLVNSHVDTLVATPIDTSNLIGLKIRQVSAGSGHSLLLAEDGNVFSFGSNSGSNTGLGTTSGDTLVATPIHTTNLTSLVVSDISADGSWQRVSVCMRCRRCCRFPTCLMPTQKSFLCRGVSQA